MKKIVYCGKTYDAQDQETVLETLLRHGALTAHSCKKGICHTCLLRAPSGKVAEKSQLGLRPSLKELGYFRACECVPKTNLLLEPARDSDLFGRAMVYRKERAAAKVIRLLLDPVTQLYYHSGQFINIKNPAGETHSYSLASVPYDDYCLEIHVGKNSGGGVSQWIFDDLQQGSVIEFQGPLGECYYFSGEPQDHMLMIASGTGLGALLGIARDALKSGHKGEIHLYHGCQDAQDLYMTEELRALTQEYANFHFMQCASGENIPAHVTAGRVPDVAFYQHRNLEGWRVYLAGSAEMVEEAERSAEKYGANPVHIHTDPFENLN